MKIEKEITINQPFVLTVEEIERLYGLFGADDAVTIRIICADQDVREFASVTEFSRFENAHRNEIVSLSFIVWDKDRADKAHIHFTKKDIDNIHIHIWGEEQDARALLEKLRQRIAALRPWYGFIARRKYSGAIIDTLISWVFVIPVTRAIIKPFVQHASIGLSGWLFIVLFILILNTAISFAWGRIKGTSFPMGVFAIRQGEQRHREKAGIRAAVITCALIALMVSIIVLFNFR